MITIYIYIYISKLLHSVLKLQFMLSPSPIVSLSNLKNIEFFALLLNMSRVHKYSGRESFEITRYLFTEIDLMSTFQNRILTMFQLD